MKDLEKDLYMVDNSLRRDNESIEEFCIRAKEKNLGKYIESNAGTAVRLLKKNYLKIN